MKEGSYPPATTEDPDGQARGRDKPILGNKSVRVNALLPLTFHVRRSFEQKSIAPRGAAWFPFQDSLEGIGRVEVVFKAYYDGVVL
jgi:hypothetical protein